MLPIPINEPAVKLLLGIIGAIQFICMFRSFWKGVRKLSGACFGLLRGCQKLLEGGQETGKVCW